MIRKNRKKYWFLLLLTLIISVISPLNNVSAKSDFNVDSRAVIKDIITSISVTHDDGSPITGSIDQWHSFKVNANFTIPNNIVKKGDTSTIKLPNEIKFFDDIDFEVKDSQGNIVANAVISATTKTVTLTYTDYVESHSDVNGQFFFYASIDTKEVTTEQIIELNFEIDGKVISGGNIDYKPEGLEKTDLIKGGTQKDKDLQILEYYVAINRKSATYPNVVIKDTLQNDSLEFIDGSFKIQKGIWEVVNGDWSLTNRKDVTKDYNIINNGKEFLIDLGDINGEGYIIRYDVRIKYRPVDGEIFKNKIEMKSSDRIIDIATLPVQIKEAGGSAEGYNFSIDILKKDEVGQSLAGAEFKLIRDRNGVEIGTIITDAHGKASFKGLLRDDYTLIETKAPDGFQLSEEEIKVKGTEFGDTKVVFKEIVNRKIELIDISGSKTWDDSNNEEGKRPKSIKINLLADDIEIDSKKVTEEDGWTWRFTDLPKYRNGNEINYRITEDVVEHYTSTVEGFNVINKYIKPTSVSFGIGKRLEGKDLIENQFLFVLEGNSANTSGLRYFTRNDLNGNGVFEKLNYEEEGIYEYKIYERKGKDKKIIYDNKEYTVVVTVSIDENTNSLVTNVMVDSVPVYDSHIVLKFINSVKGVNIGGNKEMKVVK